MPQFVDLLIDVRVLLDVGVGLGDVGLGLVVVVVGDEVLHLVIGEEVLELLVKLGGQGLVVGQHQSGALNSLDDVGHGEGFAGAGDAQQGLVLMAALQPRNQRVDGLGLVAGGLEVRDKLECGHGR